MLNQRLSLSLLFILCAVTAIACSKDENQTESEYGPPAASVGDEVPPPEEPVTTPETGVSADPMAVAPVAPAPGEDPIGATPLNDGQIVKITDTVHAAEIEQAKLARSEAKNARVKQFAAEMIKEHSQAQKKGAALAKKADLTLSDSEECDTLSSKGNETLESLKDTAGAEFDAKYMSAQVKQHQEVLDMLDQKLIPSAANASLKTELEGARAMVQKHLTHAQDIQRTLAD